MPSIESRRRASLTTPALRAAAASPGRRRPGSASTWANVRELEQCVRNVMIRGEPPAVGAFVAGSFTAEEMLRRYCTLVFAQTRNYQETARRLGIDWRTVKEKVDPAFLAQLNGGRPPDHP